MEPVSTIWIAASLASAAATAALRPRGEVAAFAGTATELMYVPPSAPGPLLAPDDSARAISMLRAPTAHLVSSAPPRPHFASLKDALLDELDIFTPNHPKGDPKIETKWEDIATAGTFIRALPSGIPLPVLMRNDHGELGMYWDNDDIYIDLNIDEDGTLSLYTRIRSSNTDDFVSGIAIEEVNSNWVYDHLSPLAAKQAKAA